MTNAPHITYIIHNKCDPRKDRTVVVYKPSFEYFLVFELIRFCKLPARFDDIGITVLKDTTYEK